jgi:NAD(P)H-hydrate epimerase
MPVWVVGAKESAERDRAAIEGGVPSRVLMERAGTAAAREIERRYVERLRYGATVFTGPGNNGGDGWVVAGSLARSGVEVTVIEAGQAKSADAVAQRDAAVDAVSLADSSPNDVSVIVDALLGTGFEGEPRGNITAAIETINNLHSRGMRVAALDLPSGLNATTGQHSSCVVADLTLSFGGIKRGTLLARDCCGEIVAIDIGLDEPRRDGTRAKTALELPAMVDADFVQSQIPPIRFDAHKGTRKHLAVIGGGKGMPGAVVLAAKAALRSGIGLVRTLVATENVGAVLAAVPSVLNSEWPSNANQIKAEIANWSDAALIGPGLGNSKQTRELVERVLREAKIPVVLDADALNVFEGDTRTLAELLGGRQALITPHVAEFARLTGLDAKEVIANRFDVGVDAARTLNATVLLKGAPTVVFTPAGERWVVARGSAALGTGGSGDLLGGIAGTLLAQLGDATTAACCAAWVHGRAAEFCQYIRGTTLEDVLYALPRAWNEGEPTPEAPVLTALPAVAR